MAPNYIEEETMRLLVDNYGIYDYLAGDYPYFNLSGGGGGGNCNNYLYGDQAIWWVFNDIGNIKTETNSAGIGVEVRLLIVVEPA